MTDEIEENSKEVEKIIRSEFENLGGGCYVFKIEGGCNTGLIIGSDNICLIDPQPSVEMHRMLMSRIEKTGDKSVNRAVFSHFHAHATLGALNLPSSEIISSDLTARMLEGRGRENCALELAREPELFVREPDLISPVRPTLTFSSALSIIDGESEIRLMNLGRGHTMGDVVSHHPEAGVIYAGDLVSSNVSPLCHDGHLFDWVKSLSRVLAFRPQKMVPGHGATLNGEKAIAAAVEKTQVYLTQLLDSVSACLDAETSEEDTVFAVYDALAPQFESFDKFEDYLPINVARARAELLGADQPEIWTREKEQAVRLEKTRS